MLTRLSRRSTSFLDKDVKTGDSKFPTRIELSVAFHSTLQWNRYHNLQHFEVDPTVGQGQLQLSFLAAQSGGLDKMAAHDGEWGAVESHLKHGVELVVGGI